MLKFTSIVEYTLCGPTYIESVLTIFGQCINVLNYNMQYSRTEASFKLGEPTGLVTKHRAEEKHVIYCGKWVILCQFCNLNTVVNCIQKMKEY